jgi:hypothetical protein
MTVYKKLQAARVEMAHKPLKKSGKNKFAGYEYFELGDFLPTAHEVFSNHGLCGVFSIDSESATLCVHDVDSDGAIRFTAPTVMAHNPKGQPIQDLGGTLTYFRRYLWMIALELTEGDMVDAAEPIKREIDPKTGEIKPPKFMEGRSVPDQKEQPWQMKVESGPNGTIEDWAIAVRDAARLGLNNISKLDDVMAIFKVNRAIFDRLKADAPEVHKDLMEEFKLAKQSFKEIP